MNRVYSYLMKMSKWVHYNLLKISKYTQQMYQRYPAISTISIATLLVIAGTLVFHSRYPYAYSFSNFYAEDGKVFMKNIIEKGPVGAIFSPFNGYLVVGQYFVGIFAEVINSLFGKGFETLAKAVAVASYVFWGLVCALPFMLFRKRIGTVLAILVSVALWSTPFGSYDYAVIGTIGNLKFAFLFIATLLVIFRNDKKLVTKNYHFYIVDVLLLLCVLTNIVSIAVLPFVLVRYGAELKAMFVKRKGLILLLKQPSVISVVILALISGAYIVIVNAIGIPKLPGYLDEPLDRSTLPVIVYRSTIYGVTFAVNYLFSTVLAYVGLAVVVLIVAFLIRRSIKKNMVVFLTIGFALVVNVLGFVTNRPGVTHFFRTFGDQDWPGLFFYAGTMLTTFLIAYLFSRTFNRFRVISKASVLVLFGIMTLLALPAAGFTHEDHYGKGAARPILANEVKRVCTIPNGQRVVLDIYPSKEWTMDLNRSQVCR